MQIIMKILGIGIDMIDINRIQKVYQKHQKRFLDHILTSQEKEQFKQKTNNLHQESCFLAKKWAAKEAAIKALGGTISFKDAEILSEPSGQPVLTILNQPDLITHISITDEYPYAQAFVIISKHS